MEPHPIPQNVTAFEFHLVGDMTLKQFLYLATGLGTAYLTFVFLAQSLPVVAWPFIFFSSFLGVAFAFLPIADRPLDKWLGAFLKAVYSPTKRVWKKDKLSFREEPTFPKRLLLFQSAIPSIQSPSTPIITNTTATILPPTVPIPPTTPEPLPSKEELAKTVELAKQAQELQSKIIETERSLNDIKAAAAIPHSDPQKYSNEINGVVANLQKLMLQASQIKQQLDVENIGPINPKATLKINVTPSPKPKLTQLVLTSLPSVINGIVVDAEGNYLDGVVVVIYDKEGLPVRALKTNKLGQFSGSTPLPNGTYSIEFEKENLVFDVLQIELEGNILPPLSIAAKKL